MRVCCNICGFEIEAEKEGFTTVLYVMILLIFLSITRFISYN